MRLIYLDTSTLNILADCLRKDPWRFDHFCKLWKANECAVAFSMVVFAEVRNHGMPAAREERYAVYKPKVRLSGRGSAMRGTAEPAYL